MYFIFYINDYSNNLKHKFNNNNNIHIIKKVIKLYKYSS